MISYIKGTVKSLTGRTVLVVANMVGYRVTVPISVIEMLSTGGEAELYCYTKLDTRNDTIELFGFLREEELRFFEQLLSISGVGPRSAMGALSVARLEDLKRTIAHGDPQLLQKVAGIGKKTAERIMIELREKIGELSGAQGANFTRDDFDVLDALKQLGYREGEAIEALRGLPKDMEGSEARVREALKRLGKRR